MDARLIDRIETNVDRAASAAFAGAVGYAVYGGFGESPFQPELGLGIGVAALISYSLCKSALGTLARGERHHRVPVFDVRELDDWQAGELVLTEAERIGVDELVLTEADRLDADELLLTEADRFRAADEPLELDDIVAEIGPESRVVRLFDRKAMPTPGQLKSRIDAHVGQRSPRAPTSDAAQALSEALAELRRSLR